MSWSGAFSYSWNPPPRQTRVTTSRTELLHLGLAYAVLTLCLTLVFSGNDLAVRGVSATQGFAGITPLLVLVCATAALTGFVAHEMAHKIAAQRRGFWAEFRASPFGLVLALVTSYLGFIFAAPGATMVGGIPPGDAESWGRTSIAGPMTNLAFAAIFYAGSMVAAFFGSVVGVLWLLILAFINSWFGTFNLFPFGVLDGRKVYRWDPGVWGLAMFGTVAATLVCVFALYVYGSPFLWA